MECSSPAFPNLQSWPTCRGTSPCLLISTDNAAASDDIARGSTDSTTSSSWGVHAPPALQLEADDAGLRSSDDSESCFSYFSSTSSPLPHTITTSSGRTSSSSSSSNFSYFSPRSSPSLGSDSSSSSSSSSYFSAVEFSDIGDGRQGAID